MATFRISSGLVAAKRLRWHACYSTHLSITGAAQLFESFAAVVDVAVATPPSFVAVPATPLVAAGSFFGHQFAPISPPTIVIDHLIFEMLRDCASDCGEAENKSLVM